MAQQSIPFRLGSWVLPTIDGDRDDLRFLDPKQCIVALYAKGSAKHDAVWLCARLKQQPERKQNVYDHRNKAPQ
jgi:hypothetical protein